MHAAGLQPVRALGSVDPSEAALADAYLQHNVCSFAKACFSQCTARDAPYDALIATATCDAMRGVGDNIEYFGLKPLIATLDVPRCLDRDSHERYFTHQVLQLRDRLAAHAGAEIGDDALRDAIALYNQLRAGLRALQQRAALRSTDFYALVHRALTDPPREVLASIEAALADADDGDDDGLRVLLLGSCMPADELGLLDIIDRSGGTVVGDLLCSGARFYERDVDPQDDPLAALAAHYWDGAYCARMYPLTVREDALRALVTNTRPHVVIHSALKFCDPYLYDAVHMRRLAKELALPFLSLETEVHKRDMGQLTTRVQSFFERVAP